MRLGRKLALSSLVGTLLLLAVIIPGAPAFALAGTVTITVPVGATGPVGTSVTINGTGFTIGSTFTVRWDGVPITGATGAVAAGGVLPATTFAVPASIAGTHNITVTTNAIPADTSNLAAFAVAPKITLNVATGQVGDTITINGTGYAASSNITIAIDGVDTITATSDALGSFTRTYVVADKPVGAHTFVARDTAAPPNSAGATLMIAPVLRLAQTSVTAGSQVALTGAGFAPSVAVTVSIDGNLAGSTTTSVAGSFTVSLVIPPGTAGVHTIIATDALTNSSFTTYSVALSVTMSPTSMGGDAPATITGSGFTGSAGVFISIDGETITTVSTDALGSFTATITVPRKPAGAHTLTVRDALSGVAASSTFTIVPSLTVSPASATGGTPAEVNGHGYAALSAIALYLDNTVITGATAITNAAGSFTISEFAIPTGAGGAHVLKAKDSPGNSATTSLTITQVVTIAPQTGAPGAPVRVTGVSFGASRPITITFDGGRVTFPPTATAADGSFSTTFTVPNGAAGAHTVLITDGTNAATANFAIVAKGGLSAVTGTVGASVTVSGAGFGPSRPISVTYRQVKIASATADATGSFSSTFTIPASATGAHMIEITDGIRTETLTFTVTPVMKLDVSSGVANGLITVGGTGFTSGTQVSVKYDSTATVTAPVDQTGGFSATFKPPTNLRGRHTVSVSDGVNTLVSDYEMDSTPPPAPALSAPADGEKAAALAAFSWTAVEDPSGVTYTLQVARDKDFGALLTEKAGLTPTGYSLSEAEKLESAGEDEPYYWRVRALDGASNESSWSPAGFFIVGFQSPPWLPYVAFGVGALAAGVIGFLIGTFRQRRIQMQA